MYRRRTSGTLVVLVAGLAALDCGPKKGAKSIIRFAAIVDQTGSLAAPTRLHAINLAVDDMNAALAAANSPYPGVAFEVDLNDSTNNPKVAVPLAVQAVQDGGAKALITDSSNDTNQTNLLAYEPASDGGVTLGVPIVAIEATSPFLCNPNYQPPAGANPVQTAAYQNTQHWLFRTSCAASNGEAVVLAEVALSYGNRGDVDGDGTVKASLYATQEPYGIGFQDAMAQAFQKFSPGIDIERLYQPPVVDVSTYNWGNDAQLLADNFNETACPQAPPAACSAQTVDGPPDVVIEATYTQYADAVQQAYLAGAYAPRFLHNHTFHFPQTLQTLGQGADGLEGCSFPVADHYSDGTTNAANTFLQEAASSYGAPEMWDAQAYDAAAVIMLSALIGVRANNVADPAEVTGAQVRDGMASLSDPNAQHVGLGPSEFARAAGLIKAGTAINYDGASGPVDFNAGGDVIDRVVHFKVSNGAFQDLEVYDCVSDPVNCPRQ